MSMVWSVGALGVATLALVVMIVAFRAARQAGRGPDEGGPESPKTDAGGVPDILLEGTDEDGGSVAFRVPGRAVSAEAGVMVGRNPFDNLLVLDHEEVSRRHFRLSASGAVVEIEDLGSTNGTRIDGDLLEPGAPTPLEDGATLRIGGLMLTVSYSYGLRGAT